jgi:hypothetical protein
MSDKIITIHNAETGEVITREMTVQELDELNSVNAPYEPTEDEVKVATDKAALLAKLGISADEAKLLLS